MLQQEKLESITNFADIHPKVEDFVISETIEFRGKESQWTIQPHAHEQLFQIFIIENSGGIAHVAEVEIPVQAPALLYLPPQVVHGFNWNTAIQGRIISLTKAFITEIMTLAPELEFLTHSFRFWQDNTTPADFNILLETVQRINDELFAEKPGRKTALRFHIGVLLIHLHRLFSEQEDRNIAIHNVQYRHYRDFIELVKKTPYPGKSIPEYAVELKISPVHLNRICKAVVGKSALWVIQDLLIQDAIKLLKHTSLTISEICYRLRLQDPSYFSRLFRKHTGISPREYRGTV